jgi:hypothetical protein
VRKAGASQPPSPFRGACAFPTNPTALPREEEGEHHEGVRFPPLPQPSSRLPVAKQGLTMMTGDLDPTDGEIAGYNLAFNLL